jgi:UDP-N-acetylmuramate: L-alanyl-gamma-D-glutamyl-meso-diaminopimelate ligase
MATNQKWIHFTGICGVTMAPLANMFKQKKWFVSGSDRGIYPPMSDYLKDRNIDIELGFDKKYLTKSYYEKKLNKKLSIPDQPDIVVVGNRVGLEYGEYKYARKKKMNTMSYAEVLRDHLVRSNSIVTAGTFGKTTTSALLALIFKTAKKNPSYMIGGISNNFKDGIKSTRSKWSIIEGDEYIAAQFDRRSKFLFYKPEFLLLTSCAWDHTDVFKTEDEYTQTFKDLVKKISRNGIIVANKNGDNVSDVLKEARCKVITYELNKMDSRVAQADWFNLAHKENKQLGEIVIYNKHTKEEFTVNTNLFGDHNRENIIGCAALARELDIDIASIQKAVKEFKGIKRRLEVRYEEENLKVIDDFASSPSKVTGSLSAIQKSFPDWHITIIFQPNVGNRMKDALKLYKGVFDQANEVIIPRIRKSRAKGIVSAKELADYLASSVGAENLSGEATAKTDLQPKYKFIGSDEKLVNYVTNKNIGKHIICFMGSYGWRNMIEEVIKKYL